ncbi:MAG: GNAT family N-acetyltransferase [Oceanobacter sp.]
MQTIEYKVNEAISTEQFIELLQASTLGARRPTEDHECMAGMLKHADLTISACYLSDLAVAESYQNTGIGKQLLNLTEMELKAGCKLTLIAAPAANDYYPKLGFENNTRCWIRERK